MTRQSVLARTSSAGNPIAQSITVPANCGALVVMLNVIGATTRAGGALTWNGFTLTQIAQSPQIAAVSPEASAELWYLLNPPAATSNLGIPNTGALTIKITVEAGIITAGNAGLFVASAGANATAANPSPGTINIPDVLEVAWAIIAGGAQTWAPSAQAGTTIANTDDGATGGGEQFASNPTPGPLTLNWTFATSDDYGACVAAFRETTQRNLENYKSNAFRCSSAGVISIGEKVR